MGKRRDWAKVGEVAEKVRDLGLSLKDGAGQFGLKPGVLYEYNRQMKKQPPSAPTGVDSGKGAEQDTERSAVGLPEDVQELIRSHRREHPSHGFKRIQDELKHKHLLVVPRKRIREVLKDAGLLGTNDSSFDKEPKGTRRFEASSPNELWQMDVANVYIQKIPVLYLVVLLDDYSRYCVAAELCRDQRADALIAVLHDAACQHSSPIKLLTDQGSGFYSWSLNRTRFQEYLDDQRIEHIVSDPHSPQTQGKVERLIQTIRIELLSQVKFTGFADAQAQIRSFIRSYNYDRPHQGIDGKRPADRYHGVVSQIEKVESHLASGELDPSRGYVVFQAQGHRVSLISSAESLEVYLDGKLLEGGAS